MQAWFDGGSRGNPGIAGSGWLLKENDVLKQAGCVFVGQNSTNNEAEYTGLISALEAAVAYNCSALTVYGDSLLVINQMQNLWQVKDPKMQKLHSKASSIARQLKQVAYVHVLRHLNKEADFLSNIAMDSQKTQLGVHLLVTTQPTTTYSGPTCAVRIRRERGKITQDCDVYVGAAWTKGGWALPRSDWCNPFYKKDPVAALEAYKDYILGNPAMVERIKTELKGRRLGCFCEPTDETCHAVWLAGIAESSVVDSKNF